MPLTLGPQQRLFLLNKPLLRVTRAYFIGWMRFQQMSLDSTPGSWLTNKPQKPEGVAKADQLLPPSVLSA